MGSSLGILTFTRLGPGLPSGRQTLVEPESSSGSDHVVFWDTGTRGSPVEVESLTTVATYADAHTLWEAYLAMPGSGPQTVVIGGVTAPDVYKVLAVQLVEIAMVPGVLVGGTVYYAILRARWSLIAVPTPPAP